MLARESPDLLVPILNCWGLSVSSQAADRDGIFLASIMTELPNGTGKYPSVKYSKRDRRYSDRLRNPVGTLGFLG
jgi:hypothetical protein